MSDQKEAPLGGTEEVSPVAAKTRGRGTDLSSLSAEELKTLDEPLANGRLLERHSLGGEPMEQISFGSTY
jgi:hypothetical protein